MNTFRHSLAFVLIGWCAALLAADRAAWAAAMRAEVRALDDGGIALSFAAGCVWGCIKQRTLTWRFAVQSVRFATIAGMLALALIAASIAARMSNVQAPSAMIFGLTSALFAATAVWSHVRGPIALVQAASTMIPLYIIAYAVVSRQTGIADDWAGTRLFQALAIEGAGIWASLLAGGIFMLRAATLSNTRQA